MYRKQWIFSVDIMNPKEVGDIIGLKVKLTMFNLIQEHLSGNALVHIIYSKEFNVNTLKKFKGVINNANWKTTMVRKI